ncbi:zinc-dependent metalloprotease [Viscerimonas tarda]
MTQKFLLTILFLCSFSLLSFAQVAEADNDLGVKVKFDFGSFKTAGSTLKSGKPLKISIPLGDGTSKVFNLTENSLAKHLDFIKTYDGVSEDGKSKLKISVFGDKVEAMLSQPGKGYSVFEPENIPEEIYRFYNLSEIPASSMQCGADENLFEEIKTELSKIRAAKSLSTFPIGDQLRIFRMAAAATGEMYSYYSSKDAVVAQIVSIINATNLIYEQELAISFSLIEKTTNGTLIFTDPTSDPFTPGLDSASASASQTGFTAMNGSGILPYGNYDVGHTFSTLAPLAGGYSSRGQAGPTPCNNNNKANGWTEWTEGAALGLIVSIFAHETGHQFSAWHTYNATGGSSGSPTFCTNGWSSTHATEPGAGSTLMGYHNNCTTPTNQTLTGNNHLSYFHATSIEAINDFLNGTGGCFTTLITGNTPPTANAGVDITIPKGTPFWLKGVATDANGDELTYTWDEVDAATLNDQGALGSNINGNGGYPAVNSTTAPLFRSEQASVTDRTFPKMTFVLNNQNNPDDLEGEDLPQVARDMKFRFVVRDNQAGVNMDEITVHVSAAGPLRVTAPNTAITASASSTTTVTWDMNSTNSLSANVSILLSIDGGGAFPYVLAQDTPNDGSQLVTIPNVPGTTQARIKVVAELNDYAEFFDVSDANFTITSSCQSYSSAPCFPADVVTELGDASLNLGLSAVNPSTVITSLTITPGSSKLLVARNDAVSPSAGINFGAYNSDTYKFRVSKSGLYTFTRSGGCYASIYTSATPSVSSFLQSCIYTPNNGTNFYVIGSASVELNECTDYYLIGYNAAGTVGISGAGDVYTESTAPEGTSYAYIAVSKSDNLIKAASATGDFRSLPDGSYLAYGISYPSTATLTSFVGQSLAAVRASACVVSSQKTMNIQVGTSTNIVSETVSAIKLLPNPAATEFQIQSDSEISKIEIYDTKAQLALSQSDNISKTVRINHLSPGVYVVKVYDSKGQAYTERLIKQ